MIHGRNMSMTYQNLYMILNHHKYNLLGMPFLPKFFTKDDQDVYDDGTWILARANRPHFSWGQSKYEKHFQHRESLLPELWLYHGTSYFKAFCMSMKGYLDDTVHYEFSSAFTISPVTVQGNKGDWPEATLVSDDEDSDEDNSSIKNDSTFWYKPKKLDKPKIVSFAKNT